VGWSALCVSRGAVGVGSAEFPLASRGSRRRAAHQRYNLVSVLITGGEGKPAGTGLVLDRSHVVTNRHVIEGPRRSGYVGHDIEVHPSFKVIGAEPLSHQSRS
jgi:S1-C subfamily serine protease